MAYTYQQTILSTDWDKGFYGRRIKDQLFHTGDIREDSLELETALSLDE